MNSTESQKFKQVYARFQRLLQLQGYSEATCDSYGRGIRRLAHWCDRCPPGLRKSILKPILAN